MVPKESKQDGDKTGILYSQGFPEKQRVGGLDISLSLYLSISIRSSNT